MGKWPKQIPTLTPVQRQTRDDWMRYWHEQLPHKYGIIEKFNHGFPAKTNVQRGRMSLEIGAGLGEHILYEDLKRQEYFALELRENMAEKIRERFPGVKVVVGDIQKRTVFADRQFDRVIAIHVLEHLPDLPAALEEVSRILKDEGTFQVVIPCEGGLAYGFARQISSVRMFNKKFGDRGVSYLWMMKKTEHVNTAREILEELKKKFVIQDHRFFPLYIPVITCNVCIGLNLKKRVDK